MPRLNLQLIVIGQAAIIFLPAAVKADPPAKILKVSTKDDLASMDDSAQPGTTIILKDGIYKLSSPLVFRKKGVWIRSESGKRDLVILDGKREQDNSNASTVLMKLLPLRPRT